MLQVDNVDSYYGQFQALHQVSLRADAGEVVVILGPNGHGKSTLLKTICGLVKPATGSITFNGKTIHKRSTEDIVDLGLVYVPEERNLFPYMTILENLKLGSYSKKARVKEKKNLERVFTLFPRLKEMQKRHAGTLSGGEARMLAIGRGMMSAATLLTLDEPSFGLSPLLREEVFARISDIKKSGVTLLIVEQSTPQAAQLADRIYIMEDGRITFDGSRQEVFESAHLRKAFLGI